jgi:IS6 family transposase
LIIEMFRACNHVTTHVTVYREVQRFTPLLIDAALPCRHTDQDRWFVDETYVKVVGR